MRVNPQSFYFLSFDFVFVVLFRIGVLHSSLGDVLRVLPKVFSPFGIVFLTILGTMCHLKEWEGYYYPFFFYLLLLISSK